MSVPLIGPVVATQSTQYVQYKQNVFDPTCGDIVRSGAMRECDLVPRMGQDPTCVRGTGMMGRHYVELPSKVIKEKLPFPGRLEGMTLKGLPSPCTLLVGHAVETLGNQLARLHDPDAVYTVTDGEAALEFTYKGKYVVDIKSTKYLDASFVVEAV